MGKGQIISGGTAGQYQVQIKYNTDRYDATVAALNAKKTKLQESRAPVQSDRNDKAAEVAAQLAVTQAAAGELEGLVSDLEVLQGQVTTLKLELAVLNDELQDLQNQIPPAPQEDITDKQAEIAAKQAEIDAKNAEITAKQAEISDKIKEIETEQKELNTLSLELQRLDQQLAEIDLDITAIDKRIEYLTDNMLSDETVSAWCADLTENLSGSVGTVEVPGERGILQIQPGYDGNAVYDQDRDGQLFPTISMTPAQAYYNYAMLPGWQKWQPVFRHGTITAIDHDANTASVTLDASVRSSAQDLVINRVDSYTDVDIEYMSCNSAAFAIDDEVLISFSQTAAMTALLTQVETINGELTALLKDKGVLDLAKSALTTEYDQLSADLGKLQGQLVILQQELIELQQADPIDPAAIAAKEAEIIAKQSEISAQQTLVDNKETEITDKEAEVTAKQAEITAKKAEKTGVINQIKSNIGDLAVPKIIGFKTNPQPCTQYIPYLFASENSFSSGGVLLCNGGAVPGNFSSIETGYFQFDADYELFSPYGATSYVSDWWYQPYEYNSVIVEWQIKNQTDANGVVWDEVPWMGGGGYEWDPTFYTAYDGYMDEGEKPYKAERTTALVRGGEFFPDYQTWTLTQTMKIEDITFDTNIVEQWYVDNGGDLTWYREGTQNSLIDHCLDQSDYSKYGVLYTTYDIYCTADREQDLCDEPGQGISNYQLTLEVLGHTHNFTNYAGGYIRSTMRLYKINDQYVCIFCVWDDDQIEIIGSAIEGGSLTITDVSSGIFYDGDYRSLFTGTRTNTLGIAIKGYVPE